MGLFLTDKTPLNELFNKAVPTEETDVYKRQWHIYKDFADVLLEKVRPLYVKDKFRLDLDNMVYAFDSSTISLCLKLCPWAKYRKNKGGIKMHRCV